MLFVLLGLYVNVVFVLQSYKVWIILPIYVCNLENITIFAFVFRKIIFANAAFGI